MMDEDTRQALKLISDAIGLLSTGVHNMIGTKWVITINEWLLEVDRIIADAETLDAEADSE